MTVQAWIVMTTTDKNTATLLDDENAALGAREVVNPLANNLGYGTLVGNWIAPARLLNDPDYVRWVTTLGILPIYVMDSETLFAWIEPNA